MPDMACNESSQIRFENGSCYNGTQEIGVWNATAFETHSKLVSTSQEYFKFVNQFAHIYEHN